MTTNTSMTHYHKAVIDHEEVWVKTIYDKVMWQQRNVVNPETGFVESSEANVYIPTLTYDIHNEDIIVKGTSDETNPNKIKNKFTITNVIPCDWGSKEMQHTELVGR